MYAKALKIVFATIGLVLMAGVAGAAEPHYRLDPSFPHLPAGLALGAVSGAATDSHGDVWIFHRGEPPLLVFDPRGSLLRSMGKGMFTSPHGLRIDREDNIWVTDNADHRVLKLSPQGKVLLSLGVRNEPGEDARHFNKPTDVACALNGAFYVSDGYGNSRVVKFDKTGRFLLAWGTKGTGPGQFNLPHAVRLDSHGDVYVGDRENNRIQVFNPNGKFLREIKGPAPFGLFLTPDDTLFVADGRANAVLKMTPEGKLLARWGSTGREPGQFDMAHGITVGKDGAVYVCDINGKRVQKFVQVGH